MATVDDVNRIIARWNGKYAGVQYNGVYQCVAWAAQYSGELTGIGYLPTPATNGAKDIYEVFASPLPAGYDRIANTPTFVPQRGDMVIWGAMPGNPFGHVAIANGVGDTNTFQSYDQNWTGGEKVHLVTHNYDYVLGVLRPKNLTSGNNTGGTMATKVSRDTLRVIHTELEGWPLVESHRGDFDAQFAASWGGQDLEAVLLDKFYKNDAWRSKREAALAYYGQKATHDAKIADLNKKLADVTKQYQDLLAKPVAPITEDQAVAVVQEKVNPLINFLRKVFSWK